MTKMKHSFNFLLIFFFLHLTVSGVTAQRSFGTNTHTSNPPDAVNLGDGEKDGKDHPCYRECEEGVSMTCYYHFHLEWYQSMSKACYDCPFNITDCERKDCVVVDGVSRQITVVNRKFPGPSIEVCQNDRIIVNLTNDLLGSGAGIHWHGMHQTNTPFMDGVPFVTQCAIQSETTFSYDFIAAQAGTHFWHSHIGLQRDDGVTGALIVRKPMRKEYGGVKYDKDEHVIQIIDWTSIPAQNEYTSHYHSGKTMTPSKLLINGRGIFDVQNGSDIAFTKAPRFNVVKGYSYRFRLINAEFSYCPAELSVDGHDIIIIASDGHYLEPVTARSLVSYAGERFDFIIKANKPIKNYWIRVRGIMNCVNSTKMRQVAVLHYNGASNGEPHNADDFGPRIRDEKQINPENQGEEQSATKTISKLQYIKSTPFDEALKTTPDYKLFVAYDLYYIDNEFFNKDPYYNHNKVKSLNKDYSVPTPQLNHISMKLPATPLLISRPSSDNFCNASTVGDKCKTTFCKCPHVISVKLNSVVEVIIIDEGNSMNANHPFHLHGHHFRVVGQERISTGTTLEEVKRRDKAGQLKRHLKGRPPFKDTVTVPDGGYTIIRFKADNPGYWLFHCHIEFHAEVGMALVFKVGEHEDMPPVPPGFPTCGDYKNNGGSGFNMGGGTISPSFLNGMNLPSNVFAKVAKQYNAYHSVIDMPQGGEMEIVFKPQQ